MKKELPDIKVLIDLYERERLSAERIAAMFGYSQERILQLLRPHVKIRQGRPKRTNPIPKDVLVKLFIEEDLNIRQIERRLGVSRDRIEWSMKEAGIEPRAKYRRPHYPELATLAVGESAELPMPQTKRPPFNIYRMAQRLGITVNSDKINEAIIRVTRVA